MGNTKKNSGLGRVVIQKGIGGAQVYMHGF